MRRSKRSSMISLCRALWGPVAVLVLLAFSSSVTALTCSSTTSSKTEKCMSETQVCASFSYFGNTFRGCMESKTEEGLDACATVKSLDDNACCCMKDLCNTKENACGQAKQKQDKSTRRLQGGSTFAPTTFAISGTEFCAVPFNWDGDFSTPCDFGTDPNGWTFVNATTKITNLQGCVQLSQAVPLGGQARLRATDLWCPTALNADEYNASTPDWGKCDCSPCRIQPNAEVAGIAQSGLCDFGASRNWSYVFANGTEVSNLPAACVRVGDLPPLGYSDLGVPPDAMWCPGDLNGTDMYDMRNTEAAQSWGICECVPQPTGAPSTQPSAVPSLAPTPAPTTVSTANGQYCEIISGTPNVRANCDFGSTGDWTYLGADPADPAVTGLVGCVPVSDFPPRLTGAMRNISETTLWCPDMGGLDVNDTYNVEDSVSGLLWGICACGNCRIKDEKSGGGGGGALLSGICEFGTDPDEVWTFLAANGTAMNVTKCATVGDFPPFGVAVDLPPSTLWCPGSSGLTVNNSYNVSDPLTQTNWGLCDCLVTQPPSVVIFSDGPTASPSILSPSPTASPATPTSAPLAFDTFCEIIEVPPNSTASNGSVCGFGAGTWEYNDGLLLDSQVMSGCVSIGAFPPLGSEGLDPSLLWCPSAQALDDQNIYNPNAAITASLDVRSWGICQCDNCQITVVDDQYSGPVQSGVCTLGTNRTWYYSPQSSGGNTLVTMVGCASIADYPPILVSNASQFPAGMQWCPAAGGLNSGNVYSFLNVDSDPTQWGVCTCDATIPPTPATLAPVPAPTRFGDTLKPSIAPTRKPSAKPTSKAPTTKAPTVPTMVPTASPHCCQVVPGGPVQAGQCDFGVSNSWTYAGFGSRTPGLQGCVKVDQYVPYNSSAFRNQDLKWCPTKVPAGLNDQDTYLYLNPQFRSNWALCECPCIPSAAPTTLSPTLPPDQVDKLALFIQADHSGSIRLANSKCLAQTNGKFTCWQLLANFVNHLVSNITEAIGGVQKLRLHLSTFSCVNSNPTNKMITDGLTARGDSKAIAAALKRLRGLSETTMHGTCPSRGTAEIVSEMQKLSADWPIAYFMVTDGRVNSVDEVPFATNMRNVRSLMRRRRGENICVSTVGYQDPREIYRLMKTECIFPAVDFIEIASNDYSKQVAYSILGYTDAPTMVGGIIPPGPDIFTESPNMPNGGSTSSSSSAANQEIHAAVVIGTTFVFVGILVVGGIYLMTHQRRRRRHVMKPHRPAEEAFWVDNPAAANSEGKPSASPPPATYSDQDSTSLPPARRRSRASSEITFIDLPPPPPLSTYPSPLPPPPPLSPAAHSAWSPTFNVQIGSPHPMLSRSSPTEEQIPTPSSSSSGMFRKILASGESSTTEAERARKSASNTPTEMLKGHLSPFSSSPARSLKRGPTPTTSVVVKADGFDESAPAAKRPSPPSLASTFDEPSGSSSPTKQQKKFLAFDTPVRGREEEAKIRKSFSPLRSSRKEPNDGERTKTLGAFTWDS